MSSKYRLFLSHSGDDSYIAERFLRPRLEKSGATVYLDAGKINYGDDFRKMLLEELRICDELLLLLTKSSLSRPWVFAELGAALIRDIRIVTIVYGVKEIELHELGILTLIGTARFLQMNEFDKYLTELSIRVQENDNA